MEPSAWATVVWVQFVPVNRLSRSATSTWVRPRSRRAWVTLWATTWLAVHCLSGSALRSVTSIPMRVMYHYGWARTLRGAKKSQISCTVRILEAPCRRPVAGKGAGCNPVEGMPLRLHHHRDRIPLEPGRLAEGHGRRHRLPGGCNQGRAVATEVERVATRAKHVRETADKSRRTALGSVVGFQRGWSDGCRKNFCRPTV